MSTKPKSKQTNLLDRFTRAKPEFRTYKFDLAVDLHERIDKLTAETGMTKDAMNDALNYAVRSLVTRLERDAKQRAASSSQSQNAGSKLYDI